jgi:hypothetical protein
MASEIQVSNQSSLNGRGATQPQHQPDPVRHWINHQVSMDSPDMPFDGGILSPVLLKKFQDRETADVGGYKIPVIKSLTAAESIFYEFLSVKMANRSQEMRSAMAALTNRVLAEYPDLASRKDGEKLMIAIVNGSAPAAYSNFADQNAELIASIYQLSNKSMSEQQQNMVLACFMVAHRVDPDVTTTDILALTKTELEEFGQFWAKEANGGVTPPPPKEPEPIPDPNPIVKAAATLQSAAEAPEIEALGKPEPAAEMAAEAVVEVEAVEVAAVP